MRFKIFGIGLAMAVLLGGCSASGEPPAVVEENAVQVISEAPESKDVSAQTYTGTWMLEVEKTENNLKNYSSLQEMFGTGLSYGAEINIGEDNKFSYYIGIGVGGEGQWQWEEDTLTAEVIAHMNGEEEQIVLQPATGEDKMFLIMEFYGEDLYWRNQEQ